LFIPGPATAEPEVLAALAEPIEPHYGPDFVAKYNECRARFKAALRTDNDLYLIVGPGTAALDAAFASAMPDGARALVPSNGWFGQRTVEMLRAHRYEVEEINFDLGQPIDPDSVVARLHEGNFDLVAWVHHETSTGVLNPVEPICCAARETNTLSVIDAVSSLAGTELAVDDWGIDLCISVANKGLAAQPGLSAISVSPQAWAAIDRNPSSRSWYLDLRTWRKYDTEWAAWHPYPTTVPSGLLAALNTSLRLILAEGLDERIVRTRDAATRVRDGLRELGFTMYVDDEYASPITTAAYAHPELPVGEMITALRDEHNVYISGGLADLAGKIFRVGHMGRAIESAETDLLLHALASVLARSAEQKENAGVEGASA
jgi:alanine-glyoxylate transaminase/serine-glyoxylate transaminase/serine-pyruvate transaminase